MAHLLPDLVQILTHIGQVFNSKPDPLCYGFGGVLPTKISKSMLPQQTQEPPAISANSPINWNATLASLASSTKTSNGTAMATLAPVITSTPSNPPTLSKPGNSTLAAVSQSTMTASLWVFPGLEPSPESSVVESSPAPALPLSTGESFPGLESIPPSVLPYNPAPAITEYGSWRFPGLENVPSSAPSPLGFESNPAPSLAASVTPASLPASSTTTRTASSPAVPVEVPISATAVPAPSRSPISLPKPAPTPARSPKPVPTPAHAQPKGFGRMCRSKFTGRLRRCRPWEYRLGDEPDEDRDEDNDEDEDDENES
jgi:hypothetical protein